MSSPSPPSQSLPNGYLLRKASPNDTAKIMYFEQIDRINGRNKISLSLWLLLLGYFYLRGIAELHFFLLVIFLLLMIINIFSMILLLAYLIKKYKNGLKTGIFSTWIVESQRRIHGCIGWHNLFGFTYIYGLVVRESEQNKGIGNCLLDCCKVNSSKPIYLLCNSQLKSFYEHRGFTDANYLDAPKELSRFRNNKNLHLMVYFGN